MSTTSGKMIAAAIFAVFFRSAGHVYSEDEVTRMLASQFPDVARAPVAATEDLLAFTAFLIADGRTALGAEASRHAITTPGRRRAKRAL